MHNHRSSIFVPSNLKAIIKSRSASQGLFQYQYLSRLVIDEIEGNQEPAQRRRRRSCRLPKQIKHPQSRGRGGHFQGEKKAKRTGWRDGFVELHILPRSHPFYPNEKGGIKKVSERISLASQAELMLLGTSCNDCSKLFELALRRESCPDMVAVLEAAARQERFSPKISNDLSAILRILMGDDNPARHQSGKESLHYG